MPSRPPCRPARGYFAVARVDVGIERLCSMVREMKGRITLRLGGIVTAGIASISGVSRRRRG
jgi:hypothetical protein